MLQSLATCFALQLSQVAVRRPLLSLEYRWRRSPHQLPKDLEAGAKLLALTQRLVEAPKEAAILFGDECDVHLLPVLRAMWMRKGQQVRVPTLGTNRKGAVFRALEPRTGRWISAIFERRRRSSSHSWSSWCKPTVDGPSCSSWITRASTRPRP